MIAVKVCEDLLRLVIHGYLHTVGLLILFYFYYPCLYRQCHGYQHRMKWHEGTQIFPVKKEELKKFKMDIKI